MNYKKASERSQSCHFDQKGEIPLYYEIPPFRRSDKLNVDFLLFIFLHIKIN